MAIGVLIGEGALPVPGLMAIVDTGREVQSTWDYLRDWLNPYLRSKVGRTVEVVPHSFARVDLYAKDGLTLMPAYTREGRLPSFCSGEWKRDAMERWLRSRGSKECDLWIGFSWDERHRAGKAHRPWCRPVYPLIERRLTRAACHLLISKAGLPEPRKSRCWMCPHQNAEEWAEVKANPDQWAKAVRLDVEVRAADPSGEGLFLHSSRVPLEVADLRVDDALPLFRHCQEGGCWT